MFKTWVCFSIRVLMRSHFFWKKNKQQNQSINKIEMRNISSESMWKMKGLTTLLFLLNNSCVLWNNLQNSLSVFLASNWNLKRPHRSVVRIFAQTWQMIGTSFFCCCRNILFSRKQKDYFVSKTDIFFLKKKHLPYCSKWFCVPSSSFTNKWKRVLFGKPIQRSLEKGKIR